MNLKKIRELKEEFLFIGQAINCLWLMENRTNHLLKKAIEKKDDFLVEFIENLKKDEIKIASKIDILNGDSFLLLEEYFKLKGEKQ
jgi:hypothetical protein